LYILLFSFASRSPEKACFPRVRIFCFAYGFLPSLHSRGERDIVYPALFFCLPLSGESLFEEKTGFFVLFTAFSRLCTAVESGILYILLFSFASRSPEKACFPRVRIFCFTDGFLPSLHSREQERIPNRNLLRKNKK